jgi:outer membrane protein assembly factor BamB
MSHDVAFVPTALEAGTEADLVYREQSSGGRGLHVLMQDVSARAPEPHRRFLLACFRDTVSAYLATSRVTGAQVFLRERVRAFEALSRAVDTRLDDFDGLGVFVALRERDAVYVLCARGASTRVRWKGVFVPLTTSGVDGVTELPLETSRSQHDLFAQTLPESLVIYRVSAPAGESAPRELLLGGAADDMAASVDAVEHSGGRLAARVPVDRLRHTVMMLAIDPALTVTESTALSPVRAQSRLRMRVARPGVLGITGAVVLAAGVAGFGYWRSAMNTGAKNNIDQTALKETPPPVLQKREVPDTSAEAKTPAPAPTPVPAPATRRGFDVAWQQSFKAAVTSSPVVAGDAVVFGGRDGKVYSYSRSDGTRQWVYAAQGGVGASPVYQSGVVVAADYAGNVVALRAGSGAVIWKRTLREKIVSTPAVTNERIAVGTANGRVYGLSLDTGRVLWKFQARGGVRGGIVSAGGRFLVPSQDGRLYALDEATGTRRWFLTVGGAIAASPASDGDIAVVGSPRGDVMAVDLARGKARWTYRAGGPVNSGLVLDDGRVYAGAGDRRVYCIDAKSGELVWRFDTGGIILSRPSVADHRVVVTSYDGFVYCLDAATGALVDKYETGEAIYSSPAVVDDHVFFGNNAGRFYCLESPQS